MATINPRLPEGYDDWPEMPVKVEIIFHKRNGKTRTYAGTPNSISLPAESGSYFDGGHYIDLDQTFEVVCRDWTCTDKEAPVVTTKKVHKLKAGDQTLRGEVREIGCPHWVGGKTYFPVRYAGEDAPVIQAGDTEVTLKSDGSVEDVHTSGRMVTVERSLYGVNTPLSEVFIKIDGGNGAWVDRDALKEALDNPRGAAL